MAKPTNATDKIENALLMHAMGQIGRVIRPFPVGIDATIASQAVEELRKKGFVHGSQREPNLTQAGVEKARELA